MKKITTILAIVGALTLSLSADATIDAQIEKIHNAPAQEKVQLMNEFKQQLATMNQEQREEAISAMQAKMQERGEITKAQVQERVHARKDQMEASGEMVRAQHMNQKQMGSQFAQEFINGGGMIGGGATGGTSGGGTGQQPIQIPTH